MKTESATMPQSPYEVEIDGEYANVLFFKNVEQLPAELGESQRYQYDMYRINGLKNRPSLIISIERDVEGWMNMAREMEYKELADAIRGKRNAMLSETDWTQTTDAPLDGDEVERYRAYRQALRDMPEQESFPYEVRWPVLI